MALAARRTLRHSMLIGLTLLLGAVVTVPVQAEDSLQLVAPLQQTTAHPAVPCLPQSAGSEWFSASAVATPASLSTPIVAATPDTADANPAEQDTAVQHFAASLRPSFPLGDDEGVTTAATLAGATLMLLGGWRWYRSSRLPWPPEGAFDQERIAYAPGSVPAWHLSGFDDLPDAEPERPPLRPLYDSLDDDDVIDVEPLPARS